MKVEILTMMMMLMTTRWRLLSEGSNYVKIRRNMLDAGTHSKYENEYNDGIGED